MKKIWFLILSLLFVPFYSFAVCEWTWECHDTIDPLNPTDEDIQFLLDLWFINATKEEVEKFWLKEIKAYYWSLSSDITTMKSVKKANLDQYITRAEMAKMISNYAKNILWKTPDTTKACLFLNSNVSADLVQYMTESCQLWLMWQWITDFRPNDYVTRAEFWTVLSRALYRTPDWEDVYYSTHLAKLKSEWIIIIDNPHLREVRWWVMLMLMRSYNNIIKIPQESGDINYLKVVVHNPFFYVDTSVVYPYPTNISEEQDNGWFMLHYNWLKRWDILQISYTGDLQTNTGWSYKELKNVVSVSLLWNIKDDYFKVRNNIPYEFKSSWYQDKPTIDSYILSWDFIDGKDWSSMTYETWYSYTYKDLWLKISTPTWWRSEFPLADSENIFSRNWVEIRRNWKDPIAPMRVEYIKVYAKDKNQSLKDIITERHLNRWCEIKTWIIVDALKLEKGTGYYITKKDEDNELAGLFCFPDDEDDYSIGYEAVIQFFEPEENSEKYYKIRVSDPSIFGKIETL